MENGHYYCYRYLILLEVCNYELSILLKVNVIIIHFSLSKLYYYAGWLYLGSTEAVTMHVYIFRIS